MKGALTIMHVDGRITTKTLYAPAELADMRAGVGGHIECPTSRSVRVRVPREGLCD